MALTDISKRDIIIVGSVCGGVIIVLLLVLLYFCCRRQRPYKDYEANPAHRRLQPVNMTSPTYAAVGTTGSAGSNESAATALAPGSQLGVGPGGSIQALPRPASVGGKPYALVTPHPSEQNLEFDNMALSPSDPQGKLFATVQSARDPLTSPPPTISPTASPPPYSESMARQRSNQLHRIYNNNNNNKNESDDNNSVFEPSSPSAHDRIQMRTLPAPVDSGEMYRMDAADYSQEQYVAQLGAGSGSQKPKKVVYEVVV